MTKPGPVIDLDQQPDNGPSFTPGPLVTMCLDSESGPAWEVVSDVPGSPVQHYAEIVAELHGSPAGTDEALARLFAAAPELYSALELCLQHLTETDYSSQTSETYGAGGRENRARRIEQARAALAAARGEN